MRSTLRRYKMATPASVHCMSRQLVFGDLLHWVQEEDLAPSAPYIISSPSTASSRIGSRAPALRESSGSGFSGLTGSDPAGNLPILTLQTVASHQSCFLLVSCRCCTRCSLCTQLYNLGIVNLSSPSESTHRFSSQHSNLSGTGNFCHHTRLYPSSCTLQQTTVAYTPVLEHLEL